MFGSYAITAPLFADVVFKENTAMIIELKKKSCTENALNQIREKQHFDSLSRYHDNLLFFGINYDEKEKRHIMK